MSTWCSTPSSCVWNDAMSERIGSPCWYACVRRVENERPSWMRSTENVIGCCTSPGRRKYPCMEWMVRSAGTVCMAATIDCASTCPPKTRPSGIHCDGPVKMSSRGASARVGEVRGCSAGRRWDRSSFLRVGGARPLDAGGSGPPVRRRSLGSLDSRWFNDSRWPTAFRSATCTPTCSAPGASKTVRCGSSRAPASSRCTPRSSTRAASSTRAPPCSACARSSCSTAEDFDVGRAHALARRAHRAGPRRASVTTTSPDPSACRSRRRCNTVTWAASHRREAAGEPLGETDAATLESAARAGIDEVADGDPRGHGRAARAARCAPRCGGAASPGSSTCRRARRSPRLQPRLPRRRPGAPVRDGPVDAPLDAARPRARAPAAWTPQGLVSSAVSRGRSPVRPRGR